MKMSELMERRQRLNGLVGKSDAFFGEFDALCDGVYAEGAISKKHKELMGLALSLVTHSDESILYHLLECRAAGAGREEIVETIKIGMIAGGGLTVASVRFAFGMLEEMGL